MGTKVHYRPDIDGLRAVAIVPVVLFHAGLPSFSGGYVGVDVFFVISGFLITGIICREIEKGRFSLISFYERRARRILPALFLVIATTIAIGWVTSWPGDFVEIAESALATIFFGSNFYFWQTTDYFAGAAEYRPFLHTWSLAVEEQFYLFFPLFLMLAARGPRRTLVLLSLGIFAVSLVASVVLVGQNPVAAFYLAPFRIWELFLGVFLALNVIPAWSNRRVNALAAYVGISLIVVSVATYSASTSFPGLAALAPCMGAALVIQAGRGGGSPTSVARLLSSRGMVFIGLISYSLYLWHWVVLALSRSFLETPNLPAVWVLFCVATSVVVAALSWHYVERPFRARVTFSRAGVFRFSGAAAAILVCLSVAIVAAEGYPGRISSKALIALAGEEDTGAGREECMGLKENGDYCVVGSELREPSGIMLGDSHAAAIMPAVDVALKAQDRSMYAASSPGCAPLLGVARAGISSKCGRFIASVLAVIDKNPESIKHVILAARWPLHVTGDRLPGESGNSVRLVSADDEDDLSNRQAFETGLKALLDELAARGTSVIILGGVPEIGWNVPRTLALSEFRGMKVPDPPTLDDIASRQSRAEEILERVAEDEGVTFVPIAPLLCNPVCQVSDGMKPLYMDDDHLSGHGAREVLGPRLAKTLAVALDPIS